MIGGLHWCLRLHGHNEKEDCGREESESIQNFTHGPIQPFLRAPLLIEYKHRQRHAILGTRHSIAKAVCHLQV